jgi:hypothetical protein
LKEAKMNPTETCLKVKRDAKGKRPQFYKDPQVAIEGVDHAMSMILVLAQEFLVMRDRLDTIERICAQKNLVLDAEIEAFHPDQNVLEIREARRQEFYTRLYYLARKDASEMASADTEERYEKVLGDIAVGDV